MTIDTCTYLGESTTPCGCASVEGRSYCAEHIGLVYKLGTARANRKKDKKTAAAVWDLESEFNAAVEELVAEGYNFDEERWDCEVEES
jgi:hypothetical protein